MAKESKKKTLVLLDSHAIIHRAYHALPDFTSGETGEPTGALYGLSAMLLKIIKDLNPDYIAAAYDLPEPTHRHNAFDEYKAGRDKIDDALIQQIERSRDVFTAFNIPIYERAGFEADDILGTIVTKLKKKKDIAVVIASGDMDTLQLVDGKRVRVYTLRKGIKDTIIYDEDGVEERFGFGPRLLPDYKGLRGDPSDNIPGVPGIGEKTATTLITAFGSIADIYKTLEKNEEAFKKEEGITPRIVKLLKEHEEEARFSHELAEIRDDAPIAFSLPKRTWHDSVDPDRVLQLFRQLGFRTIAERFRREFNVEGSLPNDPPKENKENISDEEVTKTAIALWVLNSEHTNATQEDILQFAGTRSFVKAQKHIFDELKKQGLEHVYKKIELPLIPIVEKMESEGVGIDIAYLKKLSKEYHKKLDTLARSIYKHAGTEFNINSPKQLGEILFDTLGLKGKGRTATGQRSTRESELQKLKGEHEIIDDILSYRELQKLLSTYIDNLPAFVLPRDNRLHAHFLQHGTTTGRMSSQNPNLQNIPIRTELGHAVRHAFVADKGHVLVALDYSQIELRTVAILSGDKTMQKIFKEGGDIHEAVAREVFGTHDKDARRKAKVINFGLLYGMGVNALARATDSTQKEAKAFLKKYKEQFSGMIEYMEEVKAHAHKNGYTETLFGRRRYFPGLASHLPYVRAEAERMAINAPVQGTAADIIKIAMIQADAWLTKKKLHTDVRLVLQVHDELVYEVRENKFSDVAREIEKIMEGVLTQKQSAGVPISVDVLAGDNWGELNLLA